MKLIILAFICYTDNWGAGCSIGELLLGKPLMSGKNELDQVQKMVRAVVDT